MFIFGNEVSLLFSLTCFVVAVVVYIVSAQIYPSFSSYELKCYEYFSLIHYWFLRNSCYKCFKMDCELWIYVCYNY